MCHEEQDIVTYCKYICETYETEIREQKILW